MRFELLYLAGTDEYQVMRQDLGDGYFIPHGPRFDSRHDAETFLQGLRKQAA